MSAVWDVIIQYKAFRLYFIVKYPHRSPRRAVWHLAGRSVKLVGGPGLKFKSESQTHLSKAVCLNSWTLTVKIQVYPHFLHTSRTAMPSHGCTSIHPPCGFRRKWKEARHRQCKRDIVKGRRAQGEYHMLSIVFPALYCKLLSLHPSLTARKGFSCEHHQWWWCMCIKKKKKKKSPCLPALCELMNLCMCTCDNKFSNILKAVILLKKLLKFICTHAC